MSLSVPLLAGALLAVVGSAGLGFGYRYHDQAKQHANDRLEEMFEENEDELEFSPPKISGTPLDYFRVMRHLQTQRKAAKKGYVKWYRIGSTMQRPRWVKPAASGSGPPKKTINGQPYYFEKDSMIVDEQTGAFVAVHIEGESDPINLGDPAYPGIEVDRMERIINLEAEDKPPGLFDGLGNMDTQTMMWLGIGLLFIMFAAYRYMG